jgi:hypothetical protein
MQAANLRRSIAAAAVTLVVAAPWPAEAQEPIHVGASIGLTGSYAKPGAYSQQGYELCQVGHKMVTIQWQDGKQVVVWPGEVAGAKPRFPTPAWNQR